MQHRRPNDCYVYVHWRSPGIPAYVGKGQGSRAWATSRTDPVHSRWLHRGAQYGMPMVEVIERHLTDEEAEKEETRLIDYFESLGYHMFNRDKSRFYQRKKQCH